jgi:hypothetical protein
MSTNAAETETAPTTETTTETAPEIPGRAEVLNHFAREAMGEPETAAPPANAEAENADEKALSQTEETTEAAQAETGEVAGTEENHLEEDLRQDLPEEVQEKINRRIGKEVAKTKAERDQREAMEARLAEAEAKLAEKPSGASRPASPLGDVHDLGKLEGEKLKAEQAMEQAEDLLVQLEDDPAAVETALRTAKIELKGEDGREDFSEARMKKFLRSIKTNADRTLRRTIPERERFIKTAEQAAAQAVEFLPELKDQKSTQAKLFAQALADVPELQRHPQWPLMAVIGVLGRQKLDEMIAARKKVPAAPAKRELPVKIPTPRAQPAAVPRNKPAPVDANALADALLNGDKSRTRMDYIKTFVPKG